VNNLLLTIILSIVLGISANLITPLINKQLGKWSTRVKEKNDSKRRVFERSVQYLVEHPMDEINLRTEKNGRYVRAYLFMSISVLLAANTNQDTLLVDTINYLSVLLFFFFGFRYWVNGRKYDKLVSEVWRRRKGDFPDIDLD
jgi:predicted PurR-regulated permease PerM